MELATSTHECVVLCTAHHREAIEPVYSLVRDPVEGDVPQYLVMEVQLPGIVSQSLQLPHILYIDLCGFDCI